ncbi:MAG: DnaJ domain-containing protein [bacterium]
MKDFYSTLGISRKSDLTQIKKAFREKAKQVHPDAVIAEEDKSQAAEQFIVVKTAYDILSDPTKRAEYDEKLRRQEELERIRAEMRGRISRDMSSVLVEFQTIIETIYEYHEETIRRYRHRPFTAEDFGMSSQEWPGTASYTYRDYERARDHIRRETFSRSIGVVAYWTEGPLTYVRLVDSSWKTSAASLKEAVRKLANLIGEQLGRQINPDLELSVLKKFPQDPHEMYPPFDMSKLILLSVLMAIIIYALKNPEHWLYALIAGIVSLVVFTIWLGAVK